MSFDAIFGRYSKIREHVKKQPTQGAYEFVTQRLERAQDLLQMWLAVYELYAKGYNEELTSFSTQSQIGHLSICGRVVEEALAGIFNAKIPKEVYVFLDNVLKELSYDSDFYVLVESDDFSQGSVYEEIYDRSLKNLSPPRPIKRSEIDAVLKPIKQKDTLMLYYERGLYDNAISWPLLIHECLHYFYTEEKLDSLEARCPKVNGWINEVLIDIYVTEFFGPAYAASLASYLLQYPHAEAETHPHFAVRLYTSSKYLHELEELKETLPEPIRLLVNSALNYIGNVQNQYEEVIKEVSKDIDRIYEIAKQPIQKIIAKKTQPFTVLMQGMPQKRKKIMKLPLEEYPESQVFLISDVQRYYELGIPVAANPRVLYNSFISDEHLRKGVDTLFIKESLKKWYVRESWKNKITKILDHM